MSRRPGLLRCAVGVIVAIACAAAFGPASSARAGTLTLEDLPGLVLPSLGGWVPSDPGAPNWTPPALTLDNFDFDSVEGKLMLKDGLSWNGVWGGLANIQLIDFEFDPDPFVLNNILITNISGVTQTFAVSVSLPTVFGGPNLISGSITTQVIDGNGGGATLTAPVAGSVYQALIDGTPVATMQDDPFILIAPAAGVNNQLNTFGPGVNASAVTTSIGITLMFTLTAGDTASILSRFDVVPIPEPASISLLVVAGVALLRRR